MKNSHKTIALWIFLFLLVVVVYNFMNLQKQAFITIKYSDFYNDIVDKKVNFVKIRGKELIGEYKDGTKFKSLGPEVDSAFTQFLLSNDVPYEFEQEIDSPWWQQLLYSWLPMLFLLFLFFFFMRQIQAGGGKAMSFGKSKAKLLSENSKKVTFRDVAGIDEAKEELEEIIEFLQDPKKFTKLGGRIPKGVLLMGAPGTGKTLLARAIAGEAGVPFFSISGSDFVEMFVGVGASRVRDLFDQGKKNAPCIVFIDEIDAVGRHRGAGLGGGHDEREQTLNQLLVEMDGFESNEGVIIIAATNRPDVLDPALLRPGRFDRRVIVPTPDVKGREGILKVHSKKVPLSDNVNLGIVSKGTPGFSGADLANLVNEAALIAARFNKQNVSMHDFEMAKDKILMGVERRSLVLSDEQKRTTAFHEAGHALVAKLIPGTDPIHKVTIIPRGRALGVTQQLPIEDKYTISKEFAENDITILLGGRAAEELIFNQKTTGAGNDIERATEIARKMVCEWGMSEKMGPLTFGKKEEQIFLGKEIGRQKDYSEKTSIDIDAEIKKIVSENHKRAKDLLKANLNILHKISENLLIYEVLSGADIDNIIKGKELNKEVEEDKKEHVNNMKIKVNEEGFKKTAYKEPVLEEKEISEDLKKEHEPLNNKPKEDIIEKKDPESNSE
ncbi:MAG: ATP-dependent zinc metalloprotease FtsH [Pseudomonadota bacterium]